MAFSEDYLQFVLDQLSDIKSLSHKKMFGGVGIYHNGTMFGGIMDGILHLKVDNNTREDFVNQGMKPFWHSKKSKSMPKYYNVPVEILEDKSKLQKWVDKAISASKTK